MLQTNHRLGHQTLDAACNSPETAMALRGRLAELNKASLVPVIERVLDELSSTQTHVHVKSLRVDLGEIPLLEIDRLAPERLYQRLKEALEDVLRRTNGTVQQPERRFLLAQLEYYLINGVTPFRAPADFSVEQLFLQLMRDDPQALATMLRTTGRQRYVIERIVQQLSFELLRALLNVLDPADAALILLYLLDLRTAHKEKPVVALSADAFDRFLWVLTLQYLLVDSGSMFNRRMFVRSLLKGFAQNYDTPYGALLLSLGKVLAQVRGRQPMDSSLPSVIEELCREERQNGPAPVELGEIPTEGTNATEDSIATLSRADLIVQQIRLHHAESGWLDTKAETFDRQTRMRFFDIFVPKQAAEIRGFLRDIRQANNREPLLAISHDQFERRLWVLAVRFLIRQKKLRFTPKTFLQFLAAQLAHGEGIPAAKVLAALQAELDGLPAKLPLRSSFTAVAEEFVQNSEKWSVGDNAIGLSAWERAFAAKEQNDSGVFSSINPAEGYALDEAIADWLEHGVFSWTSLLRFPQLDPERVFAILEDMPLPLLYAVLEGYGTSSAGVLSTRLSRLRESTLRKLLSRLLPALDEAASPLAMAFAQSLTMHPPQTVYRTLLASLLRGENFDLEFLPDIASPSITQQVQAKPHRIRQLPAWTTAELQQAILRALLHTTATRQTTALNNSTEDDAETISLSLIVQALLDRGVTHGREFLRTVARRSSLVETLSQTVSHAGLNFLLQTLMPPDTAIALPLLQAMEGLPSSEGLSQRRLWSVFLATVLEANASGTRPEALVSDIVAQILPSPLPARIRKQLLQQIPPEAYALREAVTRIGERSGGNRSSAPPAFDAILNQLLEPATGISRDLLRLRLEEEWERNPLAARASILHRLHTPAERESLLRSLPQSSLALLVRAMEPRRTADLLSMLELFVSAAATSGIRPVTARKLVWEALLEALAQGASTSLFLDLTVHRLFTAQQSGGQQTITTTRDLFLRSAVSHAANAGHAELREALSALVISSNPGAPNTGMQQPDPTARRPSSSSSSKERGKSPAKSIEDDSKIYILNAGLVLTAPFLPHLFHSLNMLRVDERGRTVWQDHATASRAVHLLQYLVDGRTDTAEPLLVLNKLLCGLATEIPVEAKINLTETEQTMCDKLLQAMLATWTVISSSSIAALRETFLQRQGRLQLHEGQWKLYVQRKSLDVLVDKVPWGFAVVLHPWMKIPIHVTW